MTKLKVKKLRTNVTLPEKAHATDAAFDLRASTITYDFLKGQIKVGTGIAVQPEPGYYCEVFPRSSVSKMKLQLANSVGIIDPDYTGEIILVFDYLSDGYNTMFGLIEEGDRIGQLIVKKLEPIELEEVTELDATKRSDGGFGSTGVK